MSKITIVIPTRNRFELVKMAIQSVLNQSYRGINTIVQDNSTPDYDKCKALKDFCMQNSVSYFRTDGSLSMVDNWEMLIRRASSQYVLRLDDDNILFENFIGDAISLIEEHKIDVFQGSNYYVQADATIRANKLANTTVKQLGLKEIIHNEIHNIADSNYTIYRLSLLNRIKSLNNKIYSSPLPDRFLNISLADLMTNKLYDINYFASNIYGGLTRFDYRPTAVYQKEIDLPPGFMKNSNLTEMKDVSSFFGFHKVRFYEELLENVSNPLKEHLEQNYLAQSLVETNARHSIIRDFNGGKFIYSAKYRFYILHIFKDLILNWDKVYNERRAIFAAMILLASCLKSLVSPLMTSKISDNMKVNIEPMIIEYLTDAEKSDLLDILKLKLINS